MPRKNFSYLFSSFALLFYFAPTFLFSQEKIATIAIQAKFLRSNALSEIFIVSQDNSIVKFNDEGKELARFQQSSLGNLTQFDISNPFKPLAYYPDFQTIVFFDKNLNVNNQLDLKSIGFNSVSAICSTIDNQLIIADEVQNRICRIDFRGKILSETTLLSEEKQKKEVNLMFSKAGKVYVLINYRQLLYFDNRLQLESILGSQNANGKANIIDLEINSGLLYMYGTEDVLYSKDDDFSQEILELPFVLQKNERIHISNNRFFLIKENEVSVVGK
jgi:hypothetical protein